MGFGAGYKHSPESREKMRQKALGKKASPETREKIRQFLLRREVAPATREKCRAVMLALWGRGYFGKRKKIPQELKRYAKKLRAAGVRGEAYEKSIWETPKPIQQELIP